MATQSISLDGTTSFSAFGDGPYNWNTLRLDSVFLGAETATEDNTLNVGLDGPAWRIRHLGLYNDSGFAFDVNITDVNDGIIRRIDRIQLAANSDTTMTLFNTRVDYIQGDAGGSVTLTLGSQRVRYMDLWATDNTVTMGTGDLQYAYLGTGTNVFNAGTGHVESLNFGDGSTNTVTGGNSGGMGTIEFGFGSTNILTGGSAFISRISSFGDNTFVLNGGSDLIYWDDGNTALTLNSGFYNAVAATSETFSVNQITINEGAHVRSIGVSDGQDTVVIRGSAEIVQVGANNDRVEVLGNGHVDSLLLGGGNNRFILSGQNAWAVTAFSGNDTASVNSGQIDQLYLGGGNNTVTVGATAFVGSLRTNEGNDRLTVDGGELIQVTLGGGTNTVLVRSGRIESLLGGGGIDRITVRDGEVTSINAMGGNNVIQLGTGFTGFVGTYEGRDTVTLGTGDVFTIGTGNGNDAINATAGRFDYLDAGAGNDTVTLGARGARFVVLGDGDDTISIMPWSVPEWGVEVQGDDGIDTVDLSRFTANLTLDLSLSQWQNPAAPGGAGSPPAQGYLAMIQIENAVGGSGADVISGSSDVNRLTGGSGTDVLFGGDGNDTLIGGRNNDTLTGGLGADVFSFVQIDGRDVVSDFVVGEDRFELREATGLGDLVLTQIGADVRVEFNTLRITVQSTLLAEINDAGNFLF